MVKASQKTPSEGRVLFDNRIDATVLTAQEAAIFLRISPKSLYRLTNNGLIPCRKVGSQTRFLLSELMEWVKGQ